jgi:RNA polymerase sigma-70 factor (ECF subfamily)
VAHIDAQRLQELIDKNGSALALYARQWCRTAEDAVQEALVELVRKDPPPDNPLAWLYLATRRRAMNQARAEQRRAKHQRRAGEERENWFVTGDDRRDEPIDLEALLSRLPDLEREIVVARIWGELSFAQIADLVQQPLSSVHRRYQRALTELGKQMPSQRNSLRPDHESRTTIP